jgi:hypothetical protein
MAFQYSTDQSDEAQTPQIAIDYQGDTFRTGLPLSTGGGSSNFETISQPGHTFIIGDAVLKQTDGTYLLAEGHTETDPAIAATHDNTGIVSAIGAGANADKVTVTFNGKISIGGVSGGRYETALQIGSIYYLASGIPGLCQPAYPASRTTYRPAFVALSGTDAYVIDDRSGIPTGRFTNLMDVPASYAGQSTKLVRVNAGATGLEFFASPTGFGGAFINLSDVPASYAGQGSKSVRVNAGASGLEFFAPTVPAGAALAFGGAYIYPANNVSAPVLFHSFNIASIVYVSLPGGVVPDGSDPANPYSSGIFVPHDHTTPVYNSSRPNYLVTFTNPLPSTAYIVMGTAGEPGAEWGIVTLYPFHNNTTSHCLISVMGNMDRTGSKESMWFMFAVYGI